MFLVELLKTFSRKTFEQSTTENREHQTSKRTNRNNIQPMRTIDWENVLTRRRTKNNERSYLEKNKEQQRVGRPGAGSPPGPRAEAERHGAGAPAAAAAPQAGCGFAPPRLHQTPDIRQAHGTRSHARTPHHQARTRITLYAKVKGLNNSPAIASDFRLKWQIQLRECVASPRVRESARSRFFSNAAPTAEKNRSTAGHVTGAVFMRREPRAGGGGV